MEPSIAPFIFSLILSQRILSFSKSNNHKQWAKWFRYAKYFSIFLFIVEIIFATSNTTKWIWHVFLILLIVFVWQQRKMRTLRMFLLAFIPYVVMSLLSDLTEIIVKSNKQWTNYFDTALMLSIIWLVAIIFSQYRQSKIVIKELKKRQKEDAINRAIATRKAELEGLVAVRTAELNQQKEELEHTLKELRITQSQLIQSEKMASLGELTAGIAHEIQNPLNFINNFSEVNAELISELNEERKKEDRDFKNEDEILEYLKSNEEKINHHGKRAEVIIRGMLQHSRSSTGKKELTDINALADEYLRLAYHGLRARDNSFNATMNTDFDESLSADNKGVGKINVIPQDIGRVILNLITNAFYAVNEKKKKGLPNPPTGVGIENVQNKYKPTVTVTTSLIHPPAGKASGSVLISVRDNGLGIPQSVLEKIFQPFFTTKPSGQGTGLGLSISYESITKEHGGELKVDNQPGEGVTFTIIIPI